MQQVTTSAAHPALSPETLHALGAQAYPLLPVLPQDRAGIDRAAAALLIDPLLVRVARAEGAIDVALGECLDCLCVGDGPMRLGYSSLGDYAREILSLPARRALELAKLARELLTRPLLRDAVRAGEVSKKKAEAILPVAIGDAEKAWVERAKWETVRGLRAAVRGGDGSAPEGKERRWKRLEVEVALEDRGVVNEALVLAGKLTRANADPWQWLEVICQEYLGSHPPQEFEARSQWPDAGRDFGPAVRVDVREWLERETGRWADLYQPEPVPAPDAGVDGWDRARRIDERARELMQMRREWDELLGHLCMLVVNLGFWRELQFRDLDHYATERLDLSGRNVEQRAWLERRLWDLPPLRAAMRAGKIGYEQARTLAQIRDLEFLPPWIEKAQEMTVIALRRAFASPIGSNAERQMCAPGSLAFPLPDDVSQLFDETCRAVMLALDRIFMTTAECLAVMCRHFVETHAEEARPRNTPAHRSMERDRGLCTVPGCSRAVDHSHHIAYRSHFGSDAEWNRTSVCLSHHQHGIHKGYVDVAGTAPRGLRWKLGEDE